MSDISIASDYAVAGPFYYGYEFIKCLGCGELTQVGHDCSDDAQHDWCFVYKNPDGTAVIFPSSELQDFDTFDKFDVVQGLLAGILKLRQISNGGGDSE